MNELEQKVYWTKGVDHGIELEQARIIKMLQKNVDCQCTDSQCFSDRWLWIDAIALIKGEK